MKDYIMLLKWQLKNGLTKFAFKGLKKTGSTGSATMLNSKSLSTGMAKRSDKKFTKSPLFATIIIGLTFLPILFFLCFAIVTIAPAIFQIHLEAQFVTAIIGITQGVVFFFAIASIMSKMFFSKDNEFLASLPVKSSAVFMSKFTIVYLSELTVSAFILIPTLLTFGISAAVSGFAVHASFYILLPLVVIFTPMAPLFLVSVLSLPLMYVFSFFKKRSTLSGLAGIVLFIGVMVAYFSLSFNSSHVGNVEDMVAMLSSQLTLFSNIFFFDLFIVKAMFANNLALNLFIYLAIIFGFLAISYLLSSFFYRKGLVLTLETNVGKKHKAKDESKIKQTSPIFAIMKRDLKLVLREPALAFNSLMGPLFSPVLMLIMGPMMSKIDMGNGITSFVFPMFYSLMLLCGTNFFASIAFSREGDKFYINKYIPIDMKTLLNGKLLLANFVSLIGIVLTIIASCIGFKLNVFSALALAVILVLYSCGINMFSIYRDMKKPKLHWTHYNEVVKKNANTVVPMFFGMLVGMVTMFLAMFMQSFEINPIIVWIVVLSLLLIIGVALLTYMIIKFKNISPDVLENIDC